MPADSASTNNSPLPYGLKTLDHSSAQQGLPPNGTIMNEAAKKMERGTLGARGGATTMQDRDDGSANSGPRTIFAYAGPLSRGTRGSSMKQSTKATSY